MYECNKNNISENIANDNSLGLSFGYCNNNNVSRNIANNNIRGIGFGYSCNNTISGNTANNNKYNGNGIGIELHYSDSNNVTGNTLIGNDICITEDNCWGNKFSDNGSCTYGQGDGFPFDWIVPLMILVGCALMGLATLMLTGFKRRR
jgi:parallel beta-helix repeat protein